MSIISWLEKISEFIRLKGEQLKLELLSRLSRILTIVIVIITFSLFTLFLGLFFGMALSEFLNSWLHSTYLGYLIVGGLVLLKFLIFLFLVKSGRLLYTIENALVSYLNKKDEE